MADKIPASVLYDTICDIINKDKFAKGHPEFPHTFHVIEDHKGERDILKELPGNIVSYVAKTSLLSAIQHYCKHSELIGPQTPATVEHVVKMWMRITDPIKQPAYIVDKSYEGLAFARLPFDTTTYATLTSCFENILKRCDKPNELCAFIGSLFFPEADKQQYLFMYGEGSDSKGTILRFLRQLMPAAVQSTQPPDKGGGRFWNSLLMGKRLIIMPDCEDMSFFGNGRFKSITGGDAVLIEDKGKPGFTDTLDCKFIVASNKKPDITGDISDVRRLIYVEFETVPPAEVKKDFELVLLKHAQEIISYCKMKYLELCPEHKAIPCEAPDTLIDDNETFYSSLFHDHFVKCEKSFVPAAYVSDYLISKGIIKGVGIGRVKAVWKRKFGVVSQLKKVEGSPVRVYVGMKRLQARNKYPEKYNRDKDGNVVHLDFIK